MQYTVKLYSRSNLFKIYIWIVFFTLILFDRPVYTAQIFSDNTKHNSNGTASLNANYSFGISVNTWAGGSVSAFSFSFDDGLRSHYTNVRPILNSFGFKGSFNLIPSVLVETPPTQWRYGLWPEFRTMAAEGHEIGAHSMTHPNLTQLPIGDEWTPGTLTYELSESKKQIEAKIQNIRCITFAYPYCNYNLDVENAASKYYEFARACGSYTNNSTFTGMGWYAISCADIKWSQPRNSPNDDMDELASYINIIENQSIAKGKWAVLLAHDVLPFSEIASGSASDSYYPMSNEWLTSFCQWVKEKSDSNEIWVETVGNVAKYIKEREAFSYRLISESTSKIEFEITDNLDDTVYNYPLTMDIQIPADWVNVMVTQSNNQTVAGSFAQGSSNLIKVNLIPDGGLITLSPVAFYSLSGKVTYYNSINTPLANVSITLNGPGGTKISNTDTTGNYSFPDLVPGTYTVTASKPSGWRGVNSTDALMTVRYFAKLISLDDFQKLAADVNNNGLINSTDALMIVRRYVNLISSFSIPDWLFFMPGTVTIADSNAVLDIKGISAGDVNKSYQP